MAANNSFANLQLRPLKVELDNTTDIRPKNLYCSLVIGANNFKTEKLHEDDLTTGQWNDTFGIDIENYDMIQIELLMERTFASDVVIGKGSININSLVSNPGSSHWIDLSKGDDYVGRLWINSDYHNIPESQKHSAEMLALTNQITKPVGVIEGNDLDSGIRFKPELMEKSLNREWDKPYENPDFLKYQKQEEEQVEEDSGIRVQPDLTGQAYNRQWDKPYENPDFLKYENQNNQVTEEVMDTAEAAQYMESKRAAVVTPFDDIPVVESIMPEGQNTDIRLDINDSQSSAEHSLKPDLWNDLRNNYGINTEKNVFEDVPLDTRVRSDSNTSRYSEEESTESPVKPVFKNTMKDDLMDWKQPSDNYNTEARPEFEDEHHLSLKERIREKVVQFEEEHRDENQIEQKLEMPNTYSEKTFETITSAMIPQEGSAQEPVSSGSNSSTPSNEKAKGHPMRELKLKAELHLHGLKNKLAMPKTTSYKTSETVNSAIPDEGFHHTLDSGRITPRHSLVGDVKDRVMGKVLKIWEEKAEPVINPGKVLLTPTVMKTEPEIINALPEPNLKKKGFQARKDMLLTTEEARSDVLSPAVVFAKPAEGLIFAKKEKYLGSGFSETVKAAVRNSLERKSIIELN